MTIFILFEKQIAVLDLAEPVSNKNKKFEKLISAINLKEFQNHRVVRKNQIIIIIIKPLCEQ